MTGIERLRALAYKKNFLEPAEARELDAIADQIEREQSEHVSRMSVLAVVTDMERHVSGAEGMEDSPVARWARELRAALGGDVRDHAADVSVSAYDLLPQEDREAAAWVRDHGGLESVKKLLDWVVGHCSTKQQLDFDFWLSGRVMYELGFEEDMADRDEVERRLLARLVPEGMKWPRYDTGELVRIGDKFECWCGETHVVSSVTIREGRSVLNECQPHSFVVGDGSFTTHGQCVRRPEPAVIAADGEPLEQGQTVYATHYGYVKCTVLAIEWVVDGYLVEVENEGGHKFRQTPDEFTHRAPVLAADGEPLEVGQTVWDTNGDELVIVALEDGGHTVTCRYADIGDGIPTHGMWSPSDLTHTRPVLDADGVRIKNGDTVYEVEGTGHAYKVVGIRVGDGDPLTPTVVTCDEGDGTSEHFLPSQLTHTKPEPPDSRRAIVNEIGDEMAARIDLLVSSGRWSDAN